jgi:hypothetical protein
MNVNRAASAMPMVMPVIVFENATKPVRISRFNNGFSKCTTPRWVSQAYTPRFSSPVIPKKKRLMRWLRFSVSKLVS